jgi:hypothetical protein
MDHSGRLGVAQSFGSKLIESYGKRILLVLLDGSVARGDDTPHSDLEMRIITSDVLRTDATSSDGYAEAMLEDLPVQLRFVTKDEVLAAIQKPTLYWPIAVWTYLEPHVVTAGVTDQESVIEEFKRAYNSLERKDFEVAVDWGLRWTLESVDEVRSAITLNNLCLASEGAQHLSSCSAMLVALINREYLNFGDCRYLNEFEKEGHFNLLPDNFVELNKTLLSSNDLNELGRAAESMWVICRNLSESQGFELKKLRTVSDISHQLGILGSSPKHS